MAKKFLVEPSNEFFEEIAGLDGTSARIISSGVEIKPDRRPNYKQYAKT